MWIGLVLLQLSATAVAMSVIHSGWHPVNDSCSLTPPDLSSFGIQLAVEKSAALIPIPATRMVGMIM